MKEILISNMKDLFILLVGAALVNNVVLSQFLGLCPFLGVSKRVKTAAGMGGAVIFVITISSLITSIIYRTILVKNNLEYLQTIVFILVIAALVQLVEIALKKMSPGLYQALGVYLPLITTNCAVLGVALLNIQKDTNLLFITEIFEKNYANMDPVRFADISSVLNEIDYVLTCTFSGLGTALGFTIAIVIMAGIRERIEYNDIPKSFQGSPIVLLTAGLMAIAFFGFAGLL